MVQLAVFWTVMHGQRAPSQRPDRTKCTAHKLALPPLQVRVRSVGAGGAGHGTWSAPAAVQLAAPPPLPTMEPVLAELRQLEVAGGGGSRSRRDGGGGEGRLRRRGTKGGLSSPSVM